MLNASLFIYNQGFSPLIPLKLNWEICNQECLQGVKMARQVKVFALKPDFNPSDLHGGKRSTSHMLCGIPSQALAYTLPHTLQ